MLLPSLVLGHGLAQHGLVAVFSTPSLDWSGAILAFLLDFRPLSGNKNSALQRRRLRAGSREGRPARFRAVPDADSGGRDTE